MLALLLGWASISLVFFTLARPVREWAGPHWSHYLLGAGMAAVLGLAGAWQLWPPKG